MVSYTLVWHHRWLQLKMIWGRPLLTAHQAVSANALGVFYHITACEVTTLKVHGRGIQPTSFALLLTSGNDVKLVNGDVLKDIDLVVMATGYNQRFPFLDHIWPLEKQLQCELYHHVVPTEPEMDGLGFILVIKAT